MGRLYLWSMLALEYVAMMVTPIPCANLEYARKVTREQSDLTQSTLLRLCVLVWWCIENHESWLNGLSIDLSPHLKTSFFISSVSRNCITRASSAESLLQHEPSICRQSKHQQRYPKRARMVCIQNSLSYNL